MRGRPLLLLLLLAGCSAPEATEAPADAAADEPPRPAVEPFNVTSRGTMEFGTGVEHPILSGCAGQTASSSLLAVGSPLQADIPDGYGNVTATATVESPSPLASYRVCLFSNGEEVATATGPSPLSLGARVSPGEVVLTLMPDNSDPPTAVVLADFELRLDVMA